jgi:hypothetical protein
MKTGEEIEDLKRNWRMDAFWDIEDTEGFEEHKEELLKFRLEYEKKSAEEYDLDIKVKCIKLGLEYPHFYKLAEYIIHIERQIEKLEDKIN